MISGGGRMSSQQNQKLNFDQSLSFEDVSKLFTLPLSEAAEILGVSTNVLKKLCNENGLERWPHRKYLAGKSIEEIKKEAAIEKSKVLGRISQADRQKTNVATVSAPPGFHGKDKTSRSASEMSKSQGNSQHSGSKTTHTRLLHQRPASALAVQISTLTDDEFKYGFPSSGLSRSINRWWGSDSDGNVVPMDEPKTTSDVKEASGEIKSDSKVEKLGSDKQEKFTLSAVRKRALDEGQNALKLAVLKRFGAAELEKDDKILLRRLFQTD